MSVTADCADIDPSLVLCVPQRHGGGQRETRGLWRAHTRTHTQAGDRWANKDGKETSRGRGVTARLFWFHHTLILQNTLHRTQPHRTTTPSPVNLWQQTG